MKVTKSDTSHQVLIFFPVSHMISSAKYSFLASSLYMYTGAIALSTKKTENLKLRMAA